MSIQDQEFCNPTYPEIHFVVIWETKIARKKPIIDGATENNAMFSRQLFVKSITSPADATSAGQGYRLNSNQGHTPLTKKIQQGNSVRFFFSLS
jgi:hypothetical protein